VEQINDVAPAHRTAHTAARNPKLEAHPDVGLRTAVKAALGAFKITGGRYTMQNESGFLAGVSKIRTVLKMSFTADALRDGASKSGMTPLDFDSIAALNPSWLQIHLAERTRIKSRVLPAAALNAEQRKNLRDLQKARYDWARHFVLDADFRVYGWRIADESARKEFAARAEGEDTSLSRCSICSVAFAAWVAAKLGEVASLSWTKCEGAGCQHRYCGFCKASGKRHRDSCMLAAFRAAEAAGGPAARWPPFPEDQPEEVSGDEAEEEAETIGARLGGDTVAFAVAELAKARRRQREEEKKKKKKLEKDAKKAEAQKKKAEKAAMKEKAAAEKRALAAAKRKEAKAKKEAAERAAKGASQLIGPPPGPRKGKGGRL